MSQIWLLGDHYIWRALRVNAIDKKDYRNYSDCEKFESCYKSIPYIPRTHCNYWTYLKFKNIFQNLNN